MTIQAALLLPGVSQVVKNWKGAGIPPGLTTFERLSSNLLQILWAAKRVRDALVNRMGI